MATAHPACLDGAVMRLPIDLAAQLHARILAELDVA
jgi:hypothetical protein